LASPAAALDRAAYPRAAAYVASLPYGLASYPDCRVHAPTFEPHRRDFGTLAALPGLPEPVRQILSGRVKEDAWVPAVAFQVANLLVRDAGLPSDEAYCKWVFDTSREMFDKPLVRRLMRLISPTLVVMGSAKRWGTFHQGSSLVSLPVREVDGRAEASARLTFPTDLFPPLFLMGLPSAFHAAVVGARGNDVRAALRSAGRESAEFVVSWVG
jgi:hypothetical protein